MQISTITATSSKSNEDPQPDKHWVRGVNLGGWLVLERYITPYLFSVTNCHVQGDLCWYPGALSAPSSHDPTYKQCDLSKCAPVKVFNAYGKDDYPVDEITLAQAFRDADDTDPALREDYAEQWLNFHFQNFIQPKDLHKLKEAGVTHLRVPLPHWIMGDVQVYEPWIVGKRWESFVRVCKWARELGLQVWPDIHTAPRSQNGFDNSGQALPYTTCQVWINDPVNVNRSLRAIRDITQGVVAAEIQDVVTGFGLLNEPYADCDVDMYNDFIEKGMDIVRETLGDDTKVYVSDMFQAKNFNNGTWWLDPSRYSGTYLDSHYYQVFDESLRALSPKQHIAFTCENHHRRATSCCYEDFPANTEPSKGVTRMIGEWSASYDILPNYKVQDIMEAIAETGEAADFYRELSEERKSFLQNFVEAQIVTWEAAQTGTASAWFYWTAKMEGGAFAEWDFLRGVADGWFPVLLPPDKASEKLFGTCEDILFRTDDDMSAVHEFPNPNTTWTRSTDVVDDDVVLTHGESLRNKTHHQNHASANNPSQSQSQQTPVHIHASQEDSTVPIIVLLAIVLGVVGYRLLTKYCKRSKYTAIENTKEFDTISV